MMINSWSLYPVGLARIAGKSLNDLPVSVEDILDDPEFRIAVRLASPVVYARLEKAGFCWLNCSERLKRTVRRYYIRMCSRATPFGAFAGVSLFGDGPESGKLVLKRRRLLRLENIPLKNEEIWQLNPGLYQRAGGFCCYDLYSDGGTEQVYELSSRSLPAGLLSERDFLSLSRVKGLLTDAGFSPAEADAYTGELVQSGILLKRPDRAEKKVVTLEKDLGSSEDTPYSCMLDEVEGRLPDAVNEQLCAAVNALGYLVPGQTSVRLEDFKARFLQRYEHRAVPLAEALDRENGIGYPPAVDKGGGSAAWTAAHGLLLEKWTQAGRGLQSIELRAEDFACFGSDMSASAGIGVLYELYGEQLFVKSAGGAGCSALAARFTCFDEQIRGLCKALCELESQHNPDVIFADVNFLGDPEGLWVHQHAPLRSYEIPVFGAAAGGEVEQLPLHELYLKMDHERLVLWSARLERRVIPRVNSAYNYTRSLSTAGRFLGDLQGEGIQTSFYFRLRLLFPGQLVYPAVYFEQVLISPAEWVLPLSLIGDWSKLDKERMLCELRSWSKGRDLPPLLNYGSSDRRMLWRRDERQSDLLLLEFCCRARQDVVLEASLLDGAALVEDRYGRPFHAELLSFFINNRGVYKGAAVKQDGLALLSGPENDTSVEWTYLKIYGTAEYLESFLIEEFSHFGAAEMQSGAITRWHFIRYTDQGGFHLRIRLRYQSKEDVLALGRLQTWIAGCSALTGVRHLSMHVYQREWERYGAAGMEAVEGLFYQSSDLVLKKLTGWYLEGEGEFDRELEAFGLLFSLHTLAGRADLQLYPGRKAGSADKKEKLAWDRRFRQLRGLLTAGGSAAQESFARAIRKRAEPLSDEAAVRFIRDIFHMHCNRLFLQDALEKESMCYYFLQKVIARISRFEGEG